MKKTQRVEYQISPGFYGFGTIVSVDEETEQLTIRDDEDGSLWKGLLDHAKAID